MAFFGVPFKPRQLTDDRAWALGGFAIRAALALGINLRNESTGTRDDLKEIRYRVWWSLYILEHQLSSMTGRRSCISDDDCTTPLPLPYDEEQFSTPDAMTLFSDDMKRGDRNPARSSHSPKALNLTPSTDRSRSGSHQTGSHQTWSYVQATIAELDTHLESWVKALPAIFDFRLPQPDQEFLEHRLNLGFLYYGARITTHRPCLCRLDRKIPNQSSRSQLFNRDAAAKCVGASQDMLALIPDEPNAVGLNRVGPWWNILHYVMQAATVLMLELSFRVQHMPEKSEEIIAGSKKVVRWLHQLADESLSARRAWKSCDALLRAVAPKIGASLEDLPDRLVGRGSGGMNLVGTKGDGCLPDGVWSGRPPRDGERRSGFSQYPESSSETREHQHDPLPQVYTDLRDYGQFDQYMLSTPDYGADVTMDVSMAMASVPQYYPSRVRPRWDGEPGDGR